MQANFDAALSLVFMEEGGFVDNPEDPAGATKYGITIHTLSAWRGYPVSVRDVKALTRKLAAEIYRKNYWELINGDILPVGVDYAMLDYAVNSSPEHAIRALHKVLGQDAVSQPTPLTMMALTTHSSTCTINALCDEREAWLKTLPNAHIFGKSRLARVRRVRKRALAMAQGAAEKTAENNIIPFNTGQQIAAPETGIKKETGSEKKDCRLLQFSYLHAVGAAGATAVTGQIAMVLKNGFLETLIICGLIVIAAFIYYCRRKMHSNTDTISH